MEDYASKLPTELNTYILELASDSVTSTPRPWRHRNALLARLALVCRNWRYPAQEILWRQVEIRSNEAARAFVAASGSGRRTLQLRDVEHSTVDAEERDAVIKACVGLQSIGLWGQVSCLEAVCAPSMAGVTWLSITTPSFPCLKPVVFPFALTRLTLNYSPHTPKTLHAYLFQASITSLDVNLFNGYQIHVYFDTTIVDPDGFFDALQKNILDELKHLAPQLAHLALAFEDDLSDHLDGFLQLCTQLDHFSTEYVVGLRDRLAAIPVPLGRWTVQYAMDGALDGVKEAFEAELPALAKLKVLRLELDGEEFEDEDGWIARTCRARGIRLELAP